MAIGLYGPEYLQFDEGGPAAEVRIFVFLRETKTKAVLYSDKTGLHTGPNPLWTDRRGELLFFAEVGDYDLYYEYKDTTVPVTLGVGDVVGGDSFIHVQSSASDLWEVTHNLGIRPGVTVEESINIPDDITYPAVRHLDENTLQLRWAYAASGRVTCRR